MDAGVALRPVGAVLFDLDGTLIDSAPDIAAAVNELLRGHGLPPLGLAQITAMIGGGVRKTVERAFAASGQPLAGAALDAMDRQMAPIYLRHLIRLTTLMPGTEEALARLHGAGIALAVATNKPQAATREVLLHFRLLDRFSAVVGGDAVAAPKPAPDSLLLALERLGKAAADAVFVGDSAADVGAARAAGMAVVIVRGGYTTAPVEALGAGAVCDSLVDLPAAIARLGFTVEAARATAAA